MTAADALRRQEVLLKRFEAMGLSPERVSSGSSLVVTLPLGPEPFETPTGPRPVRAARFYTVGHDRVKFASPRAFAYLPLIRILDCEKVSDVEDRLRKAWAAWLARQSAVRAWLEEIGTHPEAEGANPMCRFSLGLEDERALATALEPGRVVLPSRGPLSGFALSDPGDRIYRPRACESAVDLELDITARLERLARARRRGRPSDDSMSGSQRRLRVPRPTPTLLVGSTFVAQPSLRQSLRVRGFDVEMVRSIPEALQAFRRRSFDAVLVAARLDRADGAELIPALRSMPGVLELPIAILDDRPRPHRRESAKRAGATAYFAAPAETGRLVPPLGHMVSGVRRRRFTRYPAALSISWPACGQPAVASGVNRGGLFVRTPGEVPDGRFAIHIPDGPAGSFTIHADLEVLHRNTDPVVGPDGVGMRFRTFDEGDEARWIAYLLDLHADAAGRRV